MSGYEVANARKGTRKGNSGSVEASGPFEG